MHTISWNSEIETTKLRDSFSQVGRVLIKNVFDIHLANALRSSIDEMTKKDLWHMARHGNAQCSDSDNQNCTDCISYAFERFPICSNNTIDENMPIEIIDIDQSYETSQGAKSQLSRDNKLEQFGAFLNSDRCVNVINTICGSVLSTNRTVCFASRYVRGDYLSKHNDTGTGNLRRIAFVFGFTEHWMSHWGGQTMFFDSSDETVAVAYEPGYNSLLLFSVPQSHCVLPIANFCPEERISLTGWFLANPNLG